MLSPAEQIKERLPIIDVISSYVKLERSGINFRARCPFHNEKTPSFFVSADRGNFHCFGCGKGGDIFTFVQDIEGLTFPEALKLLADRAGVKLVGGPSNEERSIEKDISQALEIATEYFESVLKQNSQALAYLKDRGLSEETIAQFRVGYAPDGWRNLSAHLASVGVSEAVAEQAGLVIKSPKGYYDRFRARIMFPISSAQGKVVGFSGRMFPDIVGDQPAAKYVNSPETPVYNKSRVLFGFDKAKKGIADTKRAVVVEGQFDLLMAHQAGTKESVAVSGTALTSYHLGLVKRFTDKVIFAFDGDEAGFKAMERGVGLAFALGMDVSVVLLSAGVDPADCIKNDVKKWNDLLAGAKPFIEAYLSVLREKFSDARTFKKEISTRVIPHIARIQSPMERAHFISLVAQRAGVSEDVVADEVSHVLKKGFAEQVQDDPDAPNLAVTVRGRKDAIIAALIGIALVHKEKSPEMYTMISDTIQQDLAAPFQELLDQYGIEERSAMMFESELRYKDRPIDKEIKELFNNLHMEILKETLSRLMTAFADAEKNNDRETTNALMKEIRDTKTKLEDISKET